VTDAPELVVASTVSRRSVRARAAEAISLVRLRPFEGTSPEARSRERYRRAAVTTVSVGGARAISILTLFVSVPLSLSYLGVERFGLWAAISSVVGLFAFADLGLGSGLVNAVSGASGQDDEMLAHEYVSSAFFMLCALALGLGLVFAVAYPIVPWDAVFNVHGATAKGEAGPAMIVLAACFLVSMPLSIVERTQMAYQEGYINGAWAAAGNLLGLVLVLCVVAFEWGVPWLVAALAGPPALMMFLNGVVLFARRRPRLMPSWRMLRRATSLSLLRLGSMFFALQIAVALAFTSDNIVVARVFGAEDVTAYAVPMRMFSFLPMILLICFTPLWPAYGEAIARGDIAWVRRTLLRSLAFGFAVTSAVAIVLVVFGVEIVHAWAGDDVTPSMWLLSGLGIWMVISGTANAVAMFLNGASVILFQVVVALVMGAAALAAKIWFAQAVGLPGVVWGTIVAYTLFTIVPLLYYVPRVLRRLEARSLQAEMGR
jgi:O-antigen/teichoic acid export membrane protein